MRVITFLNEKGGVGKTTLATHVAAGLAIRGSRVILVDADPQGHATVAMGLPRDAGLYNLLVRQEAWADVMHRIPEAIFEVEEEEVKGELYLVPSNAETRAIPLMTSDGMVVLKRFHELKDSVDVMIVDTSPTPSLLHASIYMATDYIIYPTECEYLSLDGLVQSLQHKETIQPTRNQWGLDSLEVMGIVPMKYRSTTVLHNQNLARLRKRYGDLVWNPITLRTIWGEASLVRRPVFHLAPNSKATEEIWDVVNRVQEAIA